MGAVSADRVAVIHGARAAPLAGLVAPEDRTQAIALGAVNQNLSRAVGLAIGGALYAASSARVRLEEIKAMRSKPAHDHHDWLAAAVDQNASS